MDSHQRSMFLFGSLFLTPQFTPDIHVQGISKERFPSCVKLGEKVVFCLPSEGRKTQFFHPLFSQPGKHSLEIPCTHVRVPCTRGHCLTSFNPDSSLQKLDQRERGGT